MKQIWKPGDVIADEGGCVFWVVPTYPEDSGRPHRGIDADGNDWFVDTIDSARPLVVLDPENADDVRRLLTAFYTRPGEYVMERSVTAMQAALRELANPTPPRIDEPWMWGVVEAACEHSTERRKWVRHEDGNWYATGVGKSENWDSLIDPVLVRDGVQA